MSNDRNSTQVRSDISDQIVDDEFDLAALFQAIWNTRKLVVAISLLVLLGLMGLVAFSKLAIPTKQTFQYAVRFTFPGVENGNYPNGMAFSPSDVLAPIVLQKVYQKNDLKKTDISMRTFLATVSIHPHAPSYNAILTRYNSRLGNKKLSFVERQEIETAMKKELQVVEGRSVVLRLTIKKRLGVSRRLAEKLLHDIAREWAAYSIEQRGVLKLPDALSSQELISKKSLADFEPIIITELLNDEVERQTARLGKLAGFSGANTIVDEKSGLSINALMRELHLYARYLLGNIKNDIVRGHHFINKEALISSLRQGVENYSLINARHEKMAKNIANSLALYANRKTSAGGGRHRLRDRIIQPRQQAKPCLSWGRVLSIGLSISPNRKPILNIVKTLLTGRSLKKTKP